MSQNNYAKRFYLVGSNDGIQWVLLDYENLNSIPNSNPTFQIHERNRPFTHFRIIVPQTFGGSYVELSQLQLTGKAILSYDHSYLGPTGFNGIMGYLGLTGWTGSTGWDGETGIDGILGVLGLDGDEGSYGSIGTIGEKGETGSTGIMGFTGFTGFDGMTGSTGIYGTTGMTGTFGFTGLDGMTGFTGTFGFTGFVGMTGSTGSTGLDGMLGESGMTGFDGEIGVDGEVGMDGHTGPTGMDGHTGPTGQTGQTGQIGMMGDTGASGLNGSIGYTGEYIQGPTGLRGFEGTLYVEANTANTGFKGEDTLTGYVGPSDYLIGDLVTSATGETGYLGLLGFTGITGFTGILGVYGIQGVIGVKGVDGSTGKTGYTGDLGFTGQTGSLGPYGFTGIIGSLGFTGMSGSTGIDGQTGKEGHLGYQGFTGALGSMGPIGLNGFTAYTGFEGDEGKQGELGVTGTTGPTGFTDIPGEQGSSGYDGSSGLIGFSGLDGSIGVLGLEGQQGFMGKMGDKGVDGYEGIEGNSGELGEDGEIGISGFLGMEGFLGFTGSISVVGSIGFMGSSGYSGILGNQGFLGFTGYTGMTGDYGSSGSSGFQGFTGSSGSMGFTGPLGISGSSGFTGISGFTGSFGFVGENGFVGYTGFQGLTGVIGQTGVQGVSGNIGPPGVLLNAPFSSFHITDNVDSTNPLYTKTIPYPLLLSENNIFGVLDSASNAPLTYYLKYSHFDLQNNDYSLSIARDHQGNYGISKSFDGSQWSYPLVDKQAKIPYTLFSDGVKWLRSPGLAYSYDGIHFTDISENYGIVSIALGDKSLYGNKYVGLGTLGIYDSWDGLVWSLKSTLITASVGGSVFWNGSIWVVTGNGGIAYSTDGVTWSLGSSTVFNGTGGGLELVWNGSLWIAAGASTTGNILATSSDGMTWTSVNLSTYVLTTTALFGNGHELNLEWNGNLFLLTVSVNVASSSANTYLYSYNGVNWNAGTASNTQYNSMNMKSIFWNGTSFVGSGDSSFGALLLHGSSDGTHYSYHLASTTMNDASFDLFLNTQFSSSYSPHQVGFSSSQCTACGLALSGNTVIVSSLDNGVTWSGVDISNVFTTVSCLEWNGKVWLAGGSGKNTLALSIDGSQWFGCGSRYLDSSITCIHWDASSHLWVAGGSNTFNQNTLIYCNTDNGLYWIPVIWVSGTFIGTVISVLYRSSIWVANGNTGVAYSYDGKSWYGLGMVTGGTITSNVEWDGSQWWMIGTNGSSQNVIAKSSDGIHWFVDSFSYSVKKIVSNGYGISLLITSTGSVYYSQNGISSWTLSNGGFTQANGNTLCWNGQTFLLGSSNGTLYTSLDGKFWSRSTQSGTDLSGGSVVGLANNHSSQSFASIRSLIVAGGLDLSGNGCLANSLDGIIWNHCGQGSGGLDLRVNRVATNGQIWVAIGKSSQGGCIANSYDANHWYNQSIAFMVEGLDIVWNGIVFLVVGLDVNHRSIVASSTDGVYWKVQSFDLYGGGYLVSIVWTGSVWIGYATGSSSTTFISSDVYGLSWNVTTPPNMYFMDGSSVLYSNYGNYCTSSTVPSGVSISSSYTLAGSEVYHAFDGYYLPSYGSWKTDNYYTGGNGSYTGSSVTTNVIGGNISGDWIDIQFSTAFNVIYYYVSVDLSSPGSIPSHWSLLGLGTDGSWNVLDTFDWKENGMSSAPDCSGQINYMVVPRNISNNNTSYSDYRLVIRNIFATGGVQYGSLLECDLFVSNTNTFNVSRYAKPTLDPKGLVLYPNGCYSGLGGPLMLSLLSDLSGNWIQDYNAHGRQSYWSCSHSLIKGLSKNPITSSSFDGYHTILTGLSGELVYLSNLNEPLLWNNEISGNVIVSNLSQIYDSCSVGSRICLAGSNGSNVITYNTFSSNRNQWSLYSNAKDIFSVVYSMKSISGNGAVYVPNSLYLEQGGKLLVSGPKSYNQNLNNVITLDLNMSPIVHSQVL